MIQVKITDAGKFQHEKADCCVRTMTMVSGKPYSEVHAEFARLGRQPKKGVVFDGLIHVLKYQLLGLTFKHFFVTKFYKKALPWMISVASGEDWLTRPFLPCGKPYKPNKDNPSFENFWPRIPKKGKFIISVFQADFCSGHLFPVIDGIVYDARQFNFKQSIVQSVWEVVE